MGAPGPGGWVFAEKQHPENGPPNLGPKMGAQIWGSGTWQKSSQEFIPPFGFPTFMGMNRQDPEENPPGHVAKVELWGRGAILSVLAFPALYPIHPRRANRELPIDQPEVGS